MKRLAAVAAFLSLVSLLAGIFVPPLTAQSRPHDPVGIVSDWTSHHLLFRHSNDASVMARMQRDPRFRLNSYLRHRELWWPRPVSNRFSSSHRDWTVPLGTATFGPNFDFNYAIGLDTGFGSLITSDIGSGQFLATGGNLTVTSTLDGNLEGTYPLYPGGPAQTTSPAGAFLYDNVLYPSANPSIDNNGLLFINAGVEVNVWSDGVSDYEFDARYNGAYEEDTTGPEFNLTEDPGGGETYPSKYVFDVSAAPSCANDYVVLGLPVSPASGGQANIIGVNNLYSGGAGALCSSGPSVMFAYASGSGEVPASVVISEDGTRLAYIENLMSGSSYFHVLTIGTTGNNGISATAAAVPGTGNNAVDQTVLLSPDGGVTNQSSTNAVWVAYTSADANDFAFATSYSSTGSGYLYKITNIFNGSAPTIVWSVPIDAIPSTPVYDTVSNNVFFTDSEGRIDYVPNSATAPSVVYGSVVASGATSENAVIVDSGNQMVYATFNSNGTNAIVVQAPITLASSVSVPIGTASTIYSSPFEPDFNNAFYTGSGTPLLYIAGTGTGNLPTLYSIGFDGSGVLNSTANATAALATGTADSSPVTEFYNATLGKDYLFVGVTNNCVATVEGGTAGCVMSLDITNGFPTVNSTTTALAAAGGTSGIVVDNDSSATQASSIYYATQTGTTLVKATQSALQ
jgi:hypothetical protein